MWFHYARTMIFWSRSYLCIYFPWNPLDFWRRQFIESLYVSLETLWIWIRQFIESVYVFPETRWILETPIHWKPLSIRGPSIPLNSEALGFWCPWNIEPCTPRKPHIGSRVCYVMVLRGVGGRGGGTPYPLIPWSLWNFGPVDPLRPKLDFRSLWNI